MNAPARKSEVQNLDNLAQMWLRAKQAEDDARIHRVEIESALLLHSQPIAEGTDRVETPHTKLAVTYGLRRKVDSDLLSNAWAAIPEVARKCFKWSADVDLKHLRAVQAVDPELYARLAQFITATPAKPAVKVELKETV
jgi:hypothetical protein